LRHPLNGPAWSCLPHAIHAVQGEPALKIIEVNADAVDPEFASEIYKRAHLDRTRQLG